MSVRLEAHYVRWLEKTLIATAAFIEVRVCKKVGRAWQEEDTEEVVKLMSLAKSFGWPGRHLGEEPVVEEGAIWKQLLGMLHFVETFLKSNGAFPVGDIAKLQAFFKNFEMNKAWAKMCAEEREVDDFGKHFAEAVKERLYSNDMQQRCFLQLAGPLKDQLQAFKTSLPHAYGQNSLPAMDVGLPDLALGDLPGSCSVAGDQQLSLQVQFLCAHHRVLQAAGQLRGLGAGAGAPTRLTDDAVTVVNALQEAAQHAAALAAAPGVQVAFAANAGPTHLSDLDGFVQVDIFAELVKRHAAEVAEVWRAGWVQCLEGKVSQVTGWIVPAGWALSKDVLLSPEASEVRSAMLGNGNFTDLSAGVNALTQASTHLKKLRAGFLPPTLVVQVSEAVKEGTETVSITYALFKLTKTIPHAKDKRAEVKKLREEMKAKRVQLGLSLECEAVRLEA